MSRIAHEQDPTDPTGISVPEGEAESAAIRPRERKANAALELRLAGYQWDEVAEIVGYPDAQRAQVAFETALEAQLNNDPKMRARLREYTGRRLERLLRAVWSKAIDPDHAEQMVAHQRALAVIDRHAKLFGLDAPSEMIVHTPSNDQLQNWASRVHAATQQYADEADIFDADVVEDEGDEEQREIGA